MKKADRVFVGRPHGFVTMGIFAVTIQGSRGIFQMCHHGIVSGALFLRRPSSTTACTPARSRPMAASSTGCRFMRRVMVFTLANVGLPGTQAFVGEFLTLIGTFRVNIPVSTVATLASSCRPLCAVALIAR